MYADLVPPRGRRNIVVLHIFYDAWKYIHLGTSVSVPFY